MAYAAHQAAFARAQRPHAYVPVDDTSLSLLSAHKKLGTRGLGQVGTAKAKTRGLEAINALAVSDKGVPMETS